MAEKEKDREERYRESLDEEGRRVLERNIAESQRLIEASKEPKPQRSGGEVPNPTKTDPRHADRSVPEGQVDVPLGGSSGGEIATGGGFDSDRPDS